MEENASLWAAVRRSEVARLGRSRPGSPKSLVMRASEPPGVHCHSRTHHMEVEFASCSLRKVVFRGTIRSTFHVMCSSDLFGACGSISSTSDEESFWDEGGSHVWSTGGPFAQGAGSNRGASLEAGGRGGTMGANRETEPRRSDPWKKESRPVYPARSRGSPY